MLSDIFNDFVTFITLGGILFCWIWGSIDIYKNGWEVKDNEDFETNTRSNY
jgi:hypothetical protein